MSERIFHIGHIEFKLRGRVLYADGVPVARGLTPEDVADVLYIAGVADKLKKEE